MKKLRNKWKMRLSVLLMVVMMLNMNFTAFAEWKEESGGWRFYKSNGNYVADEVKQIQGKWYSFDQNGYMETGWLDHLGDGKSFYAKEFPGHLVESQWMKIDNEWYYFKPIVKNSDVLEGGAVKANQEKVYEWKKIQNKYYCFDIDGKMMHDQLLDVDGRIQYAQSDGSLAQGWMNLNVPDEAGFVELCNHYQEACGCVWYRFRTLEEENDRLIGGAIVAKEGEEISEKAVGDITYAFDKEGKMISRGWNTKTKHYFASDGSKATNKWLPINGVWYQFNASGDVVKYALISEDGTPIAGLDQVASSSNAVPAEVSSIAPVNKNVSVPIGERVDIQFKVELASDSNAQAQLTKDHDFWLTCSQRGTMKNKTIVDGNIYQVVYQAGKSAVTDEVYLWIDGKRSSESVTVTTTLTQSGEDDEIKRDEIKDVVHSILDDKIEDTQGAVDRLKQLNDVSTADEIRAEVHNQLLNVAATTGKNALKTLEENYIIENKITVEDPAVSAEVVEQHGNVDVTVTGAGLNAGEGENVQLQVALPEEEPEVTGNYQRFVAFDFKLLINQEEQATLGVPVVISIKAPDGFTNQDKLINLHDGEEVNVKFTVKGGKVYFVTDRFSTYVFAITDKPVTTTSSSRGGRNDVNSELNAGLTSNSRAGNWIKDANGWWIRLNDGTYPMNTWKYLDFNGVYQWYHFDAMGYMRTGWFTDTDGRRYYLNPISDGTQGAMATGWKLIDGYWYYFNPVSDGTKGALLVNTTTPDGYTVNANGQWVQ